jgi:hypothetical protein
VATHQSLLAELTQHSSTSTKAVGPPPQTFKRTQACINGMPHGHSPKLFGILKGCPGMDPLTVPSTLSSAACRPPSRDPRGSSTCFSWSSCWGRSSRRQRPVSADWTQMRAAFASGGMPVAFWEEGEGVGSGTGKRYSRKHARRVRKR